MEERNVLEYAEVIIDRQRDKINELEKKLVELRSSSEELQKNAMKNDEENKSLRLELNRKNDNDMILSMQINKENEFIQKISVLEKQLLKRDTLLEELNNLLKKRKYEYEILLQEKENLTNTVNMLRSDICKIRKNEKLKEQEYENNEKQNENFLNLYKNNNEELNITKRCLIQIESELHVYKKQNEKQKNEIQRLYKIISCMNKEKTLIPPVVLTLQNDYGNFNKYKKINAYTRTSSIQDPQPCASTAICPTSTPTAVTTDVSKARTNKLTTLKQICNKKGTSEKVVYDENLLKLNLMQSQEQKNLFKKILETLNKIQEKKIINRKVDFFFCSTVLHYFQGSKQGKVAYTNNAVIHNSSSSATESSDNSDMFSNPSSISALEMQQYAEKEREAKKNKKTKAKAKTKTKRKTKTRTKTKEEKKKKKKGTPFSHSLEKRNKKRKKGRKNYSRYEKIGLTGPDEKGRESSSRISHRITSNSSTGNSSTGNSSTGNSSTGNSSTGNSSTGNSRTDSSRKTCSSGASSQSMSGNRMRDVYSSDSTMSRSSQSYGEDSASDSDDAKKGNSTHLKNRYNEEQTNLLNYENYKEKFIGITSKEIFIYNKKGDEEPVYIIRNKYVKGIRILHDNRIYFLEHISFNNKSEKHYFFIKDDDKSLRMFYALQYAGFIKQNIIQSIERTKDKKDIRNILNSNYGDSGSSDDNGYKVRNRNQLNVRNERNMGKQSMENSHYKKINSTMSEIAVNIFTPNGVDLNGNIIPYVCNNVLLKCNPQNNDMLLLNFEENNSVINCKDYHMKCKNNKFTLYFNDFKDQHIIIPKTKNSTNLLHNVFNQMDWKTQHQDNEPYKKSAPLYEDFKSSKDSSHTSSKFSRGSDVDDVRDKRAQRGIGKEIAKEFKNVAEMETQKDLEREEEKVAKKESVQGEDKVKVERNKQYHFEERNNESESNGRGGSKEKGEGYKNIRSEGGIESTIGSGTRKEKEKIEENLKNDALSGINASEKKEDTFFIKDNILYISKDGYPFKKDQVSFNDENAFKFVREFLKVLKDNESQELTFIKSEENKNDETYIFHYPKKEKYDDLVSKLDENNFNVIEKNVYDNLKKKEQIEDEEKKLENAPSEGKNETEVDKKEKEDKFMKNNQVVVIEKGILSIYKDYGNENSVPIMKFISDFCEVNANERNGEISIKDTSNETNEKIVLDCLNKTEFHRWRSALCFGGFIKGENISSSYMNLKKHIFSINLFDNCNIKSLVRVDDSFIYVFPNEKINKPLFSFDKEKIELIMLPELRKIRIYLQRDTLYEQRYDITIPLARDFSSIKDQIEKNNFHTLSKKKTRKIRKPFVLCKTNIIAIHKDKYKLKPELIIEKKNCSVSFDKNKFTITFQIKNKSDTTQEEKKTITLSNAINFNKWMVTLKLAAFIPGYHDFEDNISFPTIVFGHTCPEATSILTKTNPLLRFFKRE
ncbi:conserved Plasmodium protein, unknown function [Plasmodium ovale]|uniref:PH domain-containing protein n=2 Tax=Plasmodium ovale TaxID=36330 RepID=A0A1A8W5I1_PLAOA|nr:hypothetical protein, conserved [Plasmodium ovale curtisi]SBS98102.1 hypothetical protein, conserved [Plasmodium ovale curtisi]SCQ16848.1 conserved Plasmodium protein, unknown function [Plasmodium ovale]